MQTIRKTIRLHRAQQAFRQSDALYRGFVGGRGAGKTWVGAYDMIRRAQRGRTYLIGSPTSVILGDTTFPTFKAIAQDLGVWNPATVRMAPYPTAILTTGASIRFRTAEDPERMRGPNLSGVWLDEASLMIREAFAITIACLREGGEQGWLSATFTPKGINHWTYDLFGQSPPKPNTELFYASTKANPFNPPAFYQTLRDQYGSGGMREQELEGRFVDADESFQVIPTAWVRAAMERWKPREIVEKAGRRILDALGVDVARGGTDKTVIAPRHGSWFAPLLKYPGKSTPDGVAVAQLVIAALKENPRALVNLDLDGPGGSPFDWLRRLLSGIRIMGVRGGMEVNARDRSGLYEFFNVRAFAYWSMRELLDPANKIGLMLPPDPELLADLTAPRWELTTRGIKVEPKDCGKPKAPAGTCCVKHRLGRSPDCGDACVYAILLPPGAAGGSAQALRY